jgi:hypothetical protein
MMEQVVAALETIAPGHSEGWYEGRRWSVTRDIGGDGRRQWLWAEELGGTDRISFNLYLLASGPALRPCEMPFEKVVAFVLGFRPADQLADKADR